MARQASYANDTDIQDNDRLTGINGSTGRTNNFTVEDLTTHVIDTGVAKDVRTTYIPAANSAGGLIDSLIRQTLTVENNVTFSATHIQTVQLIGSDAGIPQLRFTGYNAPYEVASFLGKTFTATNYAGPNNIVSLASRTIAASGRLDYVFNITVDGLSSYRGNPITLGVFTVSSVNRKALAIQDLPSGTIALRLGLDSNGRVVTETV